MNVFDFKKRFGEDITLEEVKKDFVNKINYFLFQNINRSNYYNYPRLLHYISIGLSMDPADIDILHSQNFARGLEDSFPEIDYFAKHDFKKTMIVVEILYSYFSSDLEHSESEKIRYLKMINNAVEVALVQPINMGISWKDGKFYPAGAKELNEKLISDVLSWLEDYEKVKLIYNNALEHYSKSLQDAIKRKDVISNALQAVEELTRILLQNDKAFDNNFKELTEKLSLNSHWSKILNNYKELSKEFGRHPGRGNEFIPEKSDTEAFLYLSGLVLRLILEKLRGKRR